MLNQQINLDDKKSNIHKIRFFPTTLVTRQVFKKIMNSNLSYELLIGHRGISKSISIQLYWHLSNIICSYRCRNDHITVQGLQILDEVPKIICWNIDPAESPEEVRNKILVQFF